jgi:hypothetical protein
LPAETPTVPPPTTPTGQVTALTLDAPAIPPGSDDAAQGTGCAPNAPVAFTIDGQTVGETVADKVGDFNAPLDVHDLVVGRYKVKAVCDVTMFATLDITQAAQLSPATGTLAVLLFFLLIAGLALRWQLAGDLGLRGPREADGEGED